MPEETVPRISGEPELSGTTESEEMYLITAARFAEEGRRGPLPLATLAGALEVSSTSANEMVRKMVRKGLMEYQPYKGVELTSAGRQIASRVLRTRRLWATFLANHLDFTPTEADALACDLEHVTPVVAAERLGAYLGDPVVGPLGRLIPPGGEAATPRHRTPLTEAPVGSVVEIVATAATGSALEFLRGESLLPGTVVTVEAAGESALLVTAGARSSVITPEIAATIDVVPESSSGRKES